MLNSHLGAVLAMGLAALCPSAPCRAQEPASSEPTTRATQNRATQWNATLVAEGGEGVGPIQGDVLVHTFAADGTTRDLQRVATNEAGQVEVELPELWSGHVIAAVFVKTLDVKRAGWAVVDREAEGSLRLGTLPLVPPTTVVSGTVSGFRALPEDDLDLQRMAEREITLWPEVRFGDRWRWIDGGAGVDRVPLKGGGYEIRGPMMRMHWRPDGDFDAFGWPPPAPLRLHARSRWHLPRDAVEFDAGDELTIAMEKGGTVRARVTLPALTVADDAEGSGTGRRAAVLRRDRELLPHQWLVPRLEPQDNTVLLAPGGVHNQSAGDRALPRGAEPLENLGPGAMEYEWPSLPTAKYDLELWLWGNTAPVLTVENITVLDPYLTDDRRLNQVDLRASLQVFSLQILDPNGQPLVLPARRPVDEPDGRHGVAVIDAPIPGIGRGTGAPQTGVAFPLAAPGFEMLAAKDAAPRVTVHVPGYQPAAVTLKSADSTVQLSPGPAVSFALDKARTLPADAVLEAVLVEQAHNPVPLPPASGVAHTGPAQVVVPFGDLSRTQGSVTAAGPYQLYFRVLDSRYGDWIDLEGTQQIITVPAGGVLEPVVVTLDDAVLSDVLSRLRLQ